MNVSDGYRALALIKERFGAKVDPDTAFRHIDLTLANGHATNLGLKQVICACAFDRGVLLACVERVREAERLLCAEHLDAFLALPIAPEDPPPAAPAPEPSRIILPTH